MPADTEALRSSGQPTARERLDDALERLKGAGLKRTPQRYAVLRALAGEPRHMTAQRVFELAKVHCPEIGLSTVYRTIGVLGEHGLVAPVAWKGGEASFTLCPSGHQHLAVCDRCAQVAELDACAVDGGEDEVRDRTGFVVDRHNLTWKGLCADCSAA